MCTIKCFGLYWLILKSHELAFSVFIESISRDASNERIIVYILVENIKKNWIRVASGFELLRCSRKYAL